MAQFDKRLKNILVKSGRLGAEVADRAMDEATEAERPLADHLIDRELVSEKDLIATVAREINIPPIDLARVHLAEEVLATLPQDLASYYGVLPVSKLGDTLTLAVANPFDILKLDDVKIVTGCEIRPVVSTERAIQRAIAAHYASGSNALEQMMETVVDPEMELTESDLDEDDDALDTQNEDSPVVKLVNLIIFQAIKEKASDIHIEPFEKKLRLRYRLDGVLKEVPMAVPRKMHTAMISRIKIMADLDIAEKRIPQDGKFQLKVESRQIDFRVSTLPTVFGEKAVLRILDTSNLTYKLDSLGFEPFVLARIREAIAAPYGMILVTGPTGSGKSTTLYSAVKEILSIEDNIVTVEDPVEYQVDGVNQVAVNVKRGLTFAAALRSILRQDPDIVMIGEIRDLETVEIAVKAALTGHLVLSTLHTNDAASSITRMVDMGVDPFMIASSVILVSAQRLVRRLCGRCREPIAAPPPERLLEVGFHPEDMPSIALFRPVGCRHCVNGYKGRLALLEAIPMSEEIKRIVIRGGSALDIKAQALTEGMVTLRRAGLMNASKGNTSMEEVLSQTMKDG
ncbi:MAG: type IV-A pilus assembly ATPase PilB [Planctomycetes bacterium]|nr:type IV-A pilus assembly ATPase PilB [Planctomycetota bacterium]